MVDVYHLFKLGVTAAKVLKASNGIRNAAVIFKSVRKPLAVMGAMGILDGAMDEAGDILVEKVIEETQNGRSR